MIRRLQDLILAKKKQALHLIFLDWSKAFDKVDTRCLGSVLGRLKAPENVISVVLRYTEEDPAFRVAMDGEESKDRPQRMGIRQGCAHSSFLFALLRSAIMEDVDAKVREQFPPPLQTCL